MEQLEEEDDLIGNRLTKVYLENGVRVLVVIMSNKTATAWCWVYLTPSSGFDFHCYSHNSPCNRGGVSRPKFILFSWKLTRSTMPRLVRGVGKCLALAAVVLCHIRSVLWRCWLGNSRKLVCKYQTSAFGRPNLGWSNSWKLGWLNNKRKW